MALRIEGHLAKIEDKVESRAAVTNTKQTHPALAAGARRPFDDRLEDQPAAQQATQQKTQPNIDTERDDERRLLNARLAAMPGLQAMAAASKQKDLKRKSQAQLPAPVAPRRRPPGHNN